ncbi:LPS export ABC transporter periplasmic protein LptC [Novosphingobium sp. ZN18A2]|uniref:LPS export ABC transporter periplasmic protein LptC n=1 Tax=Novosphingobium sp. ZN18A2 TaxID=3079861 RepID=UPI0030D39BE2
MTVQADQMRSRRQHFAAPGGQHDRLVKVLAVALPAGIGVLAAVMILAPLSPRGEVSFLLDRNKVAVVKDRFRTISAMYRGQDDKGRNFSVTAGNAVQASADVPVVEMKDLTARIMLKDGPAILSAGAGAYNFDKQLINVKGPVNLQTADGYRLVAQNVQIDLNKRLLVSDGRVDGRIPAGTFSADRIIADLAARTVTLDGNARLKMEPGKLQMP